MGDQRYDQRRDKGRDPLLCKGRDAQDRPLHRELGSSFLCGRAHKFAQHDLERVKRRHSMSFWKHKRKGNSVQQISLHPHIIALGFLVGLPFNPACSH
jgi:hypothetical protein